MYGNELYKLLLAREIIRKQYGGYMGQMLRQNPKVELEKIISEDITREIEKIKVELNIPVYLNKRKNYGIIAEHIAMFNNNELIELFNGVHNIEIPYIMGVNMNEVELLAIYCGVVRIKRVESNKIGYEGFYNAIREINNISFRSKAIGELRKIGFNPHNTNPGDQKKRFELMPERIKQEFLRSYLEELKISYQAVKNDVKQRQGNFYDRNSDGFNRNFYITDITDVIENSYKKAKEQHLNDLKII